MPCHFSMMLSYYEFQQDSLQFDDGTKVPKLLFHGSFCMTLPNRIKLKWKIKMENGMRIGWEKCVCLTKIILRLPKVNLSWLVYMTITRQFKFSSLSYSNFQSSLYLLLAVCFARLHLSHFFLFVAHSFCLCKWD